MKSICSKTTKPSWWRASFLGGKELQLGKFDFLLASSRTPTAQESCSTDQERAQYNQSSRFGEGKNAFHVMKFKRFCQRTTADNEQEDPANH
jgi:hypothetical protein